MTEKFAEQMLDSIVIRNSSLIEVFRKTKILGYCDHLVLEGNELRSMQTHLCYHHLHFDVEEIYWIHGEEFTVFALSHRYQQFKGLWIAI